MEFQIPPPELIPFGLRAMKVVAMANGEFAEQERALLGAAQKMFGTDHDVDALIPISPAELAENIADPALRRQLVDGMLVLALADGEAGKDESSVIEGFASALDVDLEEVQTFHKLSEGHYLAARLDVARHFWAREHAVAKIKEQGFSWLVKAVAALTGIREDTPLAEKYRALKDYPDGSLGRAYYDFIKSNEFSLPGEKGSPPEIIIMHDLTHVLSGYQTNPTDEICVTAFHAGYRKQHPFTWILFSMMQFNLGISMTPISSAENMKFDAAKTVAAFQRGVAMNADLTDGTWDYFADMKLPLKEVRKKYNIQPLSG